MSPAVKKINLLYFLILLCLLSSCGGSDTQGKPNSITEKKAINILSYQPAKNAQNITLDSVISVSFSQDITSKDIRANLVAIPSNNETTGTTTFNNRQLVFTPVNKLTPATEYEFQLTVLSQISNNNFSWRFVTAPSLTIVEHYPQANQTEVSVDTNIIINLSELVLSEKLNLNVKLQLDGREVIGKTKVNNNSITFIPQTALDYSSSYSVQITSESQTEPYEFSFTTATSSQQTKQSFHPNAQKYGTTEFTLIPTEKVSPQEINNISFGIPFPKGFLKDVKQFRILDESGQEVPIATKVILPWRNTEPSEESIRSVLVQLDVAFNSDEFGILSPKHYLLEWGETRTTSDLPLTHVEESWVLVNDAEYPASEQIYEPLAYALFSSMWYGDSVIKTRLYPVGSHPDFSAFDNVFQLFGDTAIDHVDPRVIDDNLIPFKTSYAAWLFDRAMTIYQLAFKTGQYKYLRAAHRATQFYLKHINENGYFSLKSYNDMKYSYGESLVTNYLLQGGESTPEIFTQLISAWDSFNSHYTLSSNFWTERHAAVQLLGYITAYEITGNTDYKDKAKAAFTNLETMQNNPVDGAPYTGALMHTAESHGEGGDHFIASPWMSAYLIDAIERYYIQLDDTSALRFIIKMANFFKTEGDSLYEWKGWQGKDNYYVPHYLAGIDLTEKQHASDGSLDLEHTPDVTKIFAAAYFSSCAISECDESYLHTIAKLYNSSTSYTFPYWIRTAAPESGLASYRLAPPRKFNWWFKSSANIDFLIGKNTVLPSYNAQAPKLSLTQVHDAKYFSPDGTITFRYKLSNNGNTTAKNVVIFSNVLKFSPDGLLSIIEVDEKGFNRQDAAVWKFASVAPNETIDNLFVTVKVNDFPVLPSLHRPIGSIIAFASLSFCDENDDSDTCQFWQTRWDTGMQTYQSQSNWQIIPPVPPITPPVIDILTPEANQGYIGVIDLSANVHDDDGIAKVEFWLNDERLATISTPPYTSSLQTNALDNKEQRFTVKAWDNFGSFNEKTVVFNADLPDETPPEITISSPINNKDYCEYVDVNYQVSDNYSISHCAIKLDDTQVEIADCSPYRINKIIPIFKSVSQLTFDQDNAIVTSQDGKTLIGTADNVTFEESNHGLAAFFNGLNARIHFQTTKLTINEEATIAFWMKPVGSQGMLLSQDWGYIGNEHGWAIYLGANKHRNNNELSISWSSGNNKNNLNEQNVVQTASNSIQLNQWQHIAVRKKSDVVDIFINGTLLTSKHLAVSEIAWPFSSEKALSIGQAMNHPNLYNDMFHGSLDELIIWDQALTDREVAQLFQPRSIDLTKELTIYAFDKAGNIGESSKVFTLKSCNISN